MLKHTYLMAAFIPLAACASLTPEPTAPLQTVDAPGWSTALTDQLSTGSPALRPIWQRIEDPILGRLIQDSRVNNVDLAIARSRIREARAGGRLDDARFRPQLGSSSSILGQRQSENGVIPAGRVPGVETEQAVFDLGWDAQWELDLFGRRSLQTEISNGRVSAAETTLAATQASLISDITLAYIELRAAQAEAAALDSIIASQREQVFAIQKLRSGGEASDLSVQRATAQLTNVEALKPDIAAWIEIQIWRLATLSGNTPADLEARLRPPAPLPQITSPITIDVVSDVLRRRPDIQRAEEDYLIAAKSADLTALDIYPTITLFGGVGPNSTQIENLFDPASLAGELGALIAWTALDGGRRSAQNSIATEQVLQAEASYRKAVAIAIEEVERAASQLKSAQSTLSVTRNLSETQMRVSEMTEIRYNAGVEPLVDLLASQQAAIDADLSEVRAQAAYLIAQIQLEKALGLVVEDTINTRQLAALE